MLKPRKRITKKQLKEDKLITFVSKLQIFLEEEWRKLVFGIGGAFVVFIISYFIYQSDVERENRAAGELFPLEYRYFASLYDSTLVVGLERFLDRYEDTKSGSSAVFYLANTYYNLGNYPQALSYYQKFIDDHSGPDFMEASAIGGIAACYEQQNMNNEASQYYLRAVEKFPNVFITPQHMLGAARAFMKRGQIEDARVQCQEVIEKYPDSQQATEAEILLAKM